MKSKKLSSAKNAANWNKLAWLALEICNPCSKSFAAQRKSGATILAPAARGRNIRSVAARTLRESNSKSQTTEDTKVHEARPGQEEVFLRDSFLRLRNHKR